MLIRGGTASAMALSSRSNHLLLPDLPAQHASSWHTTSPSAAGPRSGRAHQTPGGSQGCRGGGRPGLDLTTLLHLILDRAVDLLGAVGIIWLWDEALQVLTLRPSRARGIRHQSAYTARRGGHWDGSAATRAISD